MTTTMTRLNLLSALRPLALGAALAVGAASFAHAEDPVEIRFAFWGSAFEKKDVEKAIAAFNEAHPDIRVVGQHIPNQGYVEKITAQLAAGDPPDVAYLDQNQAFPWAAEGKILDLKPYLGDEPEKTFLKSTVYRVGDTLLGTGLATGVILTYYNKDLFDAAGVPYPPAKASEAWDWDTFVANAKKLTKDRNGKTADQEGFDPNAIDTYGVSFPTWWGGYLPFIFSNGGKFASDDGTKLLLDQPEAVEALQKLQDLIYVHHVAPTPTQAHNLPTADILLQSKKVAIGIDGMWKVTDFANLRFNWGVGVLPKLKEPATVVVSVPKVIFAATKHPKEAFEFYSYISDPTKVDLFKAGLWAPHEKEYFTDPAKIASWIDGQPGVYPPEARDAIVDYELNHTPYQPPVYWLKNVNRITDEAVTPAIDQIWNGTKSAKDATAEAVKNAAPLLQGRW